MLRMAEHDQSEDTPLKAFKSHLPTILSHGGERAETLLALSVGVSKYSRTKLDLDAVQNSFAIVSVVDELAERSILTI